MHGKRECRPSVKLLAALAAGFVLAAAPVYARPVFAAIYAPQYLVTVMSPTSGTDQTLTSPLIGFQTEGFADPFYFEVDLSQPLSAVWDIVSGGNTPIDGGTFQFGFGLSLFGDNPTVGIAATFELQTVSLLKNNSYGGFGGAVFAVFSINDSIFFLPKIKYVYPVFNNKAGWEVNDSIELSCDLGMNFGGGLGISIQPTLSFRSLTAGGSVNRYGVRVGVGFMG